MDWPDDYACAPGLRASAGAYALRPIRWADREPIRQWRNQQIDALRQVAPLTAGDQDRYFTDVVRPQLDLQQPPQVLFGFLDEDRLVGYGGIVHLCWPDRRGEVSFLTSSDRASGDAFRRDWEAYLAMLVPICRDGLGLHKLTTETYGFRTEVISFLESAGFAEEGVLVDHHRVGDRWVNSHAHGLLLD